MMDDNVSTKSSESSITTSGEYEIVTDSNVVTPIEQKLNDGDDDDDEVDPISGVVALGTRKSVCGVAGGGSIVGGAGSDKHEMTDALRELELEHNDNYGGVGGGGGGDGGGRSEQSKDTAINANTTTTTTANTKPISAATTTTTKQIVATAAGTEPLTGSLSRQQKSLTLPLACTSSPALVVPDAEDDDDDLTDVTMRKAQTLQHPLKRQQQPLPKKMSPSPPGGVAAIEPNRVGHSVFYDCIDASPAGGGSAAGGGGGLEEKKDAMKPEKNDTDDEVSDIDQGCTIFSGVTYLGAANINAPKSETHIYRIMSELNSGTGTGTSQGLKISISIPNCSEGLVVLHDAESNTLIATYEIQSIILYYRGPVETPENGCFAFTWLHGESLFQCHVFRCHIPEAVNQVSACFQKAFQTYPPSMTCSMTSAIDSNMINSVTSDLSGNPINTAGYEFIVSLEIREKVAKNAFSAVPRDRNCFKLRAHTDKEVYITVKQVPSSTLPPLLIERCFGVLLSPGKLVRQADMQLIDMVTMGYQQPQSHMMPGGGGENVGAGGGVAGGGGGGAAGSGGGALSSGNGSANGGAVGGGVGGAATNASSAPITPLCLNPYYIRAEWKASEKAFEQLNVETAKTFLTVAVDIVMRGIQEPVRFVIETPVTIQSPGELRLMDHFISKRPMTLGFYLHLKRTTDEFSWEVSSIDPSEEIAEPPSQASAMSTSSTNFIKMGMSNLSRMVRSSSIVSFEDDCPSDNSSDGDEPLLSGTGEVSKDCSQDTLDEWDPILKEWDGEKRPKNLSALVRVGVPEALREKVWQKLANVEGKMEMHDMYKTLITKETKCETVIQRDIHRTFPAHKCFKETGGSGQDALFKVSKAYAVYDSEVGYCQGLSFIAASLLLHMPEEDAFCVLVSLMYDYGLRDLYKQGFEVLYLRLYQLDRLIKDHLPKLHEHFLACGIETHMYASQWFLTLFTARFPLCFVFHVLDVFLLDGVPLLFQVAVTLLSICEPDLRQLDFEGILKYFRVTLPKKCRSSSQARRVMKMACERKIKKLKQYEEEFLLKRQHKERLEKEAAVYEKRFGDERRKLQAEIDSLMQQLNTANERAIDKEKKHTGIIHDYKLIIQRLEHDMTTLNETLGNVMNIVAACKNCSQKIEHAGQQSQSHGQASSGDNQALTGGSGSSAGGGATLGPLDPLNVAGQRIRELELELAQAKLEKVQAECRNQDLNHQLCATINEMQTNRNSWQPWLSKTFNSIQEKVSTRGHRDAAATATFQSYTNQTGPGGVPLAASSGGSESETNSPSSNQEFKAFALGGSPKLPSKFQTTAKLRNSIDSLRNIVAPLDAPAQPPAAFKGLQQQQSQF